MRPCVCPVGRRARQPSAPQPYTFKWEDVEPTKEMLRELIFREILVFHPEAAADESYRPQLPP